MLPLVTMLELSTLPSSHWLLPAALHDHGSDGGFADAFAVFPPATR